MSELPTLDDPRIDHAYCSCPGRPEQHEGRLHDGRWFFFYYRFGHAYVGIGPTLDDAIEDDKAAGRYCGGIWDGEWLDADARNNAFRELLTAALASHRAH